MSTTQNLTYKLPEMLDAWSVRIYRRFSMSYISSIHRPTYDMRTVRDI
jgi:hypothetical protein